MSKFANKYDPKEAEDRIRKFWEKEEVYKFNEDTKKPIFSIDTPPPTVSGRMHVGHSFSYSQTDMLARYKRMTGNEVFYPFGTDDNGLATEKLVQKEKGVNLRKMTREEAVKITMEYLEEERPNFVEDFKKVGLSCDFDINYSSISPESQKISQGTFVELFNKGLIEQREGPVPWDRVFQTPIAQAELEDQELKSTLNYVKAKIKGTENTYLIYATTRPELLFGCVGMNVEDEGYYVKLKVGKEFWITGKKTVKDKFKDFDYEIVEELKGKDIIGEFVIIPLANIEVEITHDISVKADYGTGVVYYCTYGGMDCIEWMARRPEVKPIRVIDEAGKLTKLNGKYEGLVASTEGRKVILEDLEKEEYLVQKENIVHIVNVGERSGAEVEFIVAKQWYVKYLDKKEYFFEMAQKFNWYPEFMKHRLENWIKGLNWDWGFSRQRHFGIPIPVWTCEDCGKQYVPQLDKLPVDPISDKAPVSKCECGSIKLIGEKDVMDTWFTSGSTPTLAIEKVKNEKTKKKLFPMNLRPQGHDIINFWLFYTMAKNNLLHDMNPFKDVAVSGWVLDPQGKKMSKSKGNVISPQLMIEKYSADALRFGASTSKLGNDLPFPEKELVSGIKVTNKLFNANKFASMLLENFKAKDRDFELDKLNSIDKWIISKAQKSIKEARTGLDKYDYSKAKLAFESFFMRDVADNYIEIVKQRLWKPEEVGKDETLKAQKALYYSLYNSLKGLAPIMPYITEEIYQNFYREFEKEKSIHITSYPEFVEKYFDEEVIELGDKFVEIVGHVRKYKAEKQLSMKEELESITITCNDKQKEFIEESINDLKSVTSAREIKFESGDFLIVIN